MNRLKKYLDDNDLKPTPWAKKHGLSPSTISRFLKGEKISFANAQKISAATYGELSVLELMIEQKLNY